MRINMNASILSRELVLVLIGRFSSQLGGSFFTFLMALWVLDYTGSAMWTGFVTMLSQLVTVLSGPLVGAIADAHPRKMLIVLCDIIRACVLLLFSVTIFLGSHILVLSALLVMVAVMSITGGLLGASFVPFLADVVSKNKLAPSLSISRGAFFIGDILGKTVGGILYPILGIGLSLSLDGALYFGGALLFSLVTFRTLDSNTVKSNGPRGWKTLLGSARQGLQYIVNNRGLLQLFLMLATVNLFVAPVAVLIPVFAKYSLLLNSAEIGKLYATMSAGSLLGYIIVALFPVVSRTKTATILVCLVALGVALVAVPFLHDFRYVACSFFFNGASTAILNVSVLALLDAASDPNMRGRVQASSNTVSSALMPLSTGLSGAIAELLHKDVSILWCICGAACIVSALLIARSEAFRLLNFPQAEKPLPNTAS